MCPSKIARAKSNWRKSHELRRLPTLAGASTAIEPGLAGLRRNKSLSLTRVIATEASRVGRGPFGASLRPRSCVAGPLRVLRERFAARARFSRRAARYGFLAMSIRSIWNWRAPPASNHGFSQLCLNRKFQRTNPMAVLNTCSLQILGNHLDGI